eukprot:7488833-Karenia_brevis.AAC.1
MDYWPSQYNFAHGANISKLGHGCQQAVDTVQVGPATFPPSKGQGHRPDGCNPHASHGSGMGNSLFTRADQVEG